MVTRWGCTCDMMIRAPEEQFDAADVVSAWLCHRMRRLLPSKFVALRNAMSHLLLALCWPRPPSVRLFLDWSWPCSTVVAKT